MNEPALALAQVRERIRRACLLHDRNPDDVRLLAVSKRQPVEAIAALAAAGQREFGENYVQEALPKIAALRELGLTWHFIGRLQRNKTRDVAAHFDWVHTVDRIEIAERLSAQRPAHLPPLVCLIEVNVSGEATKGGVSPTALPTLVEAVRRLPGLEFRGLMCLPEPTPDFNAQRAAFRCLHQALTALALPDMNVLSMGTSADFEAAIAEGAHFLRLGTVLFGPRH